MLLYLFDALFCKQNNHIFSSFWHLDADNDTTVIIFYLTIQTHLNTYTQYMRLVQQKRKTKYAQL